MAEKIPDAALVLIGGALISARLPERMSSKRLLGLASLGAAFYAALKLGGARRLGIPRR